MVLQITRTWQNWMKNEYVTILNEEFCIYYENDKNDKNDCMLVSHHNVASQELVSKPII